MRTHFSLALLGLSDWIPRQRFLQKAYSILPPWIRRWVLAKVAGAISRGSDFGTLRSEAGKDFDRSVPAAQVRSPSLRASDGLNVFGYLRGQFGLGESARMYAKALLAAGYPVALNDIDLGLPHGMQDASLMPHVGTEAPFAANLIFVNPDFLRQALESIGQAKLEGRHTIACWFWELDEIPEEWCWAIDAVDCIMVASSFVEEAFRKVTAKPILRVPLPVSGGEDSGLSRQDFGLVSDEFVFLTTFDFHSSIHRKNPYAAIAAFRKAFPPDRNDVKLVVKSSNGHHHPGQLRELLSEAVRDPRIVVRDQILDKAHMHALQRCADSYVSLHRAEGFGLGLAECMALGKPVIGTAWSGNLDFMTNANSCLVDYRLVPVGEGEYQYAEGMQWAEADVDQAAAYMKRLVDAPGFASNLGTQAKVDIRDRLSPSEAARAITGYLESLSGGTNKEVRSEPHE